MEATKGISLYTQLSEDLFKHPFNDFEIEPCKEIKETEQVVGVEQCKPEEAEFWGVYVRYIPSGDNGQFGGAECIADCDTKEIAEDLVKFLKAIAKNYKPEEDDKEKI